MIAQWLVLKYKSAMTRRWFIRRLQGFARIICDTSEGYEVDPSALLILMAKLSGTFSKGTYITIILTSGADPDLQACSMHLHRSAYA